MMKRCSVPNCCAQAKIDLMLRVSQAYFDALVAAENVSVPQTQIKAVEQ